MSEQDKMQKCIELLQNKSNYTTRIIAELLELDLIHNNGDIVSGLEHDLWCMNLIQVKAEEND